MFTFSKVRRPQSPVTPIQSIYTAYQQRPTSPAHYNLKQPFKYSSRPMSPNHEGNIFYKPVENPVKLIRPTSPHQQRKIATMQYNPSNLYYNGISSQRIIGSNRNRSHDYSYERKGHIRNGGEIYLYSPDSNLRYDGRRIFSPLPGTSYTRNTSSQRQVKGYKINITYSSPPSSPLPGNKPELLNSKSSLFSFGQPKKPQILKSKKPGVRRMNSLGSSASEQNYPIYVHYDDNKQSLKPNSNQFSNSKQISSIYQRNFNSQSQKPLEKPVPSKIFRQASAPQENIILNHSISQQIVNSSRRKNEQESTGTGVAKIDEHTYEQEHRIANLLAGQLDLNYDYFRDVDKSDRSISDYVAL